MKRIITLTLALLLAVSLCACGAAPQEEEQSAPRTFTDSCGREVELPAEIDAVVPSGSLAQIVLFTLCPDKVQSLSSELTGAQKQYIDEAYHDLPVTGNIYGGSGTANYEEIIAAAPDVIIDVGEAQENIAQDLDDLQEQTGIPVIFVEASLTTMAEAYEKLGEVVGEPAQAAACAEYIRETLAQAEERAASIPEEDRVRVLYAQGEYGTEAFGAGNVHTQVLDVVGAENVAVLDKVSGKGVGEVSMEQVYLWDPEVVILAPGSNYDTIFDDPAWAVVSAVKNGAVYEIPNGPYNWMDRPPSVQRMLGIRWLGNLLYPEVFDDDMIAETQRFYELFFRYDLSEAEARELMANSTYKAE